jgi:hypothetical protein
MISLAGQRTAVLATFCPEHLPPARHLRLASQPTGGT